MLQQSGFPRSESRQGFIRVGKYLVLQESSFFSLLFLLFVFILFWTSHVAHPTLNELLARIKEYFLKQEFMAQRRGSLGFLFPKCPLLLSSDTGSFTLHSDQSFPNTPSQLCSRIGIDPRRGKNGLSKSLSSN